jgi:hypothetical protein
MESKSMNRARALKLAGMRSKTGGERVLAALERGRRGLGDGNGDGSRTLGPRTTADRPPKDSQD